MTGKSVDVVIIGGGIVGASAAYRLVRAGRRVALVDRADHGYATGAGAGIIAPGLIHAAPPAFHPLSFASVAYYPELLDQLAEDGETDTGYGVVGSLFVATNEAELARLPELLRLGQERRDQGVHNVGAVRQVTGAEARDLFPALGDVPAAIHLTGSARLDARIMRRALVSAAKKRGLQVIDGSAAVLRDGDRATAVRVNGQSLTTEAVIIAAGAWSADLAAILGFALPVSPQRGQILHMTMPNRSTVRWPVILGFHSHYQLTFPESKVVVGATREPDAGYDYRLTVAGVQEVLNEALRISPGLGEGTIQEIRIGFRPASPDGLPMLGQAPGYQNIYVATGHGPSGLQLGPYSGATVADLALGLPPGIDLAPYSPQRFQ